MLNGLFNSSCDVTFTMHFDLEVDFYLCDSDSAPADVTAATCPAESTVFLGPQYYKNQSGQVHQTFTEWDAAKAIDSAILQGLWDGLTKDFVDCATAVSAAAPGRPPGSSRRARSPRRSTGSVRWMPRCTPASASRTPTRRSRL
ncbi:hypothetical protein GXW82_11895 [Streptacidiphilus sp. 4-A2]|nr:hypothetical protein [Streptacidiphilus sp. 4-A2]